MARIRSKDTSPEWVVRRLAHRLGYRFRLHCAKLPGKPDLVFARLKKIIEVRGCFWHQHGRCIDSHIPKSRADYWIPKLEGNCKRDRQNLSRLRKAGWSVMVVWECQVKDTERLEDRIQNFLSR